MSRAGRGKFLEQGQELVQSRRERLEGADSHQMQSCRDTEKAGLVQLWNDAVPAWTGNP